MRESKNNKKSNEIKQINQIRKNKKVVGSKMMAGVLAFCVSTPFAQGISSLNAPTYAAETTTQESEETQTSEAAQTKEEVVYIMLDADGNVDSVNVVNIFGKGEITDYGNYSSVKMLTSTNPISQDGDKITFVSDQDRLYYQGTLDNAQIPWAVSIEYTLDGKKITPEELAGQSGALKIHVKITENEKFKGSFYDSCALQARDWMRQSAPM